MLLDPSGARFGIKYTSKQPCIVYNMYMITIQAYGHFYTYIHTYIHTYITLHYITLHYITLHYITLHYITLHYITLHYITLHYITLHYITLHYITLHYITLHYITLHYITLHYITLHYITLHYITLHYITLHYITLHYITLHYITLHYITLHYITLHYIHTYIHTYVCIKNIEKNYTWLPQHVSHASETIFQAFGFFSGKTSWFRPPSHGLGMTIIPTLLEKSPLPNENHEKVVLCAVRICNPYNKDTYFVP